MRTYWRKLFANVLREQLVAQRITAGEIAYIIEKLIPTVETLMKVGGGVDKEMLDAIKAFVSVETLTVLQLVVSNFKAAVGEPLTEVVASLVDGLSPKPNRAANKPQPRR